MNVHGVVLSAFRASGTRFRIPSLPEMEAILSQHHIRPMHVNAMVSSTLPSLESYFTTMSGSQMWIIPVPCHSIGTPVFNRDWPLPMVATGSECDLLLVSLPMQANPAPPGALPNIHELGMIRVTPLALRLEPYTPWIVQVLKSHVRDHKELVYFGN